MVSNDWWTRHRQAAEDAFAKKDGAAIKVALVAMIEALSRRGANYEPEIPMATSPHLRTAAASAVRGDIDKARKAYDRALPLLP
jgi:hypothetical protein